MGLTADDDIFALCVQYNMTFLTFQRPANVLWIHIYFFILQQIFFILLKLQLISIKNENFPFISIDRRQANVSIFTGNLS